MWYLLTVLIALLVLRRSTDGGSRRITNGLILLTLLLALGSTPLVGILLESSLRVDHTNVSGSAPEFIIVLAGGRTASSSPEEDVLNIGGRLLNQLISGPTVESDAFERLRQWAPVRIRVMGDAFEEWTLQHPGGGERVIAHRPRFDE